MCLVFSAFRIRHSSLQHIWNHLALTSRLDKDSQETLEQIFTLYLSTWQQVESVKRDREARETSLYQYQSQSHGDELTEEERDDIDRQQHFPAFDQVSQKDRALHIGIGTLSFGLHGYSSNRMWGSSTCRMIVYKFWGITGKELRFDIFQFVCLT